MKGFDFSRWALVAPNDDSGLGRMAEDFKSVLPITRHLVIASQRLSNRPIRSNQEILIDPECRISQLESNLRGLQGVVFFEKPNWHPDLLPTLRRLGVHSVCVPMWEWFRGVSPQWKNCDFFACPNEICLKVVRSYGYQNSALIPWTLDLKRFPQRIIRGPGRHFVHNAGIVDADDRKGTHDTIAAFSKVNRADICLTVRVQKSESLPIIKDERIQLFSGNLPSPTALYAEGDVFIQPSKLEGIGFMVLEAVASGLPVITQDYPPMNEWVSQRQFRAYPRRWSYPAYSSAWIEHSHLRRPNLRNLTNCIVWATQNNLEQVCCENRCWAERIFAPARLLQMWEELLGGLTETKVSPPVDIPPEPLSPCLSINGKLRQRIKKFTGYEAPLLRNQWQ